MAMNTQAYYYQYFPYHQEGVRSSSNHQIIDNIQQAVNGEYSAIACYQQLAQMAPTQEERDRILEIQNDEKRHFQVFRQLYTHLTGQAASYTITEKCPNEYKSGLNFAFVDEQKTVDFYHELADQITDPEVKGRIRRIAADEQNHATWFLYFLTRS